MAKMVLKNGKVWSYIKGKRFYGKSDVIIEDEVVIDIIHRDSNCAVSNVFNFENQGFSFRDCEGMTIIPGLIDAHNHLSLEPGDEFAQSQESDAMRTLRAAKNGFCDLRSGVTAMRTLGEKNYIDLEYRKAAMEGIVSGPTISASGPAIVATGGLGWYMHQEVDGPEEIRKAVRLRSKLKVDTIKVMVSGGISDKGSDPNRCYFSQEELNTLVQEAKSCGLKTSAHIYGGPGAYKAINAGIDTIEHGFFFDDDVLKMMHDNNTNLVITPSVLSVNNTCGPKWRRVFIKMIQQNYPKVINKAKELGLRMAIGSDCNHEPYFFINLLCLLSNFSLSSDEILFNATSMGAEIAGFNAMGEISKGNIADLLILKDDPIQDIKNLFRIDTIIKSGQLIDPLPYVENRQ